MKNKYGYLGFLSLLGLVGLFTEERSFLAFFAFAVDFSYFRVQPDEFFLAYMDRSAARGFFALMFTTLAVTLCCLPAQGPSGAMLRGVTLGWAAAVAVHALSAAWYHFRESWGASGDA